MKKILDYIKKNKIFCIIMALGFLLLILMMKNVVMYADDFALKVISDEGWKKIFLNQYQHYFRWGGGFTPLLVTVFLRFNFWFWKIFIASLITIIVGLSVKLFNLKEDKLKSITALILWDCIFFVTVLVTRETFYWLDGSMAYVFTAFQVFIYMYYLISRIFYNKSKKYDCVILPLIAFLAGWSSAQTGAIAFVMPTLIILFAYFIKKIKIKPIYIITNILGIVGFCIFYFAPGNSSRMSVIGEFASYSIIEKIVYRINNIYSLIFNFNSTKFTSLPFFILLLFSLLACFGIVIIRKKSLKSKIENNILKITTIYLLIFILMNLYIFLQLPGFNAISNVFINFGGFKSKILMCVPYAFCSIAMVAALINCYFISKTENRDEIIIFPTIAFFSQGIMVMAPYSQYRTELIGLIFIWPIISLLILLLYMKRERFVYFAFIPFIIYNINFIILILLLFIFTNDIKRKIEVELLFIISLFTLLSFLNYVDIYDRYSINKSIYDKNIEILKNNSGENQIYITKPQYIYYGFGGLAEPEFVQESVEKIYNLGQVKFILLGDESYEN